MGKSIEEKRMRPKSILATATLGLVLGFGGCRERASESKTEAHGSSPATESRTDGRHARAGVVPGSYEDWCGEHEVRETLCTRCDSSLVPAFKATGDWCAEHGLPESQCRQCNPDLAIARPPKTAVN
jgi:hypothetical protein